MWHLGVISKWTVTNGENITRLSLDYAGLASMSDVGETPATELVPDENFALLEVLCSTVVYQTMQVDPDIIAIVWEEEIEDED